MNASNLMKGLLINEISVTFPPIIRPPSRTTPDFLENLDFRQDIHAILIDGLAACLLMIYPTLMNILIFRTDISTQKKVKKIKPLFNDQSSIAQWSIDLEDIDNVLRLEVSDEIKEHDIISLVETCGFLCEELPD